MYIRSKSPSIKIEDSSYVISGIERDYTGGASKMADTNHNSLYRPAISYGLENHEFSADAIVGAIRLSMVGKPWGSTAIGDSYTNTDYTSYKTAIQSEPCQFLWLPRPDIKLDISGGLPNHWTLGTGLINTSADNYKHTYYVTDSDSTTSVTKSDGQMTDSGATLSVSSSTGRTTSTLTPVPILGSTKEITNFNTTATSTTMDGATYYVYRYTLNIWIEGSDPEARRAMGDGQFYINLFLSS
jgi:hypothetical protein